MPWSDWIQGDDYEAVLEVQQRAQVTKETSFSKPKPATEGQWFDFVLPETDWVSAVNFVAAAGGGATASLADEDPMYVRARGLAARTEDDEAVIYQAEVKQGYLYAGITEETRNYRDPFPVYLLGLTEGEDYAPIPGRLDEWGDPAYVEYEPGAITLQPSGDIRVDFGPSGSPTNYTALTTHLLQGFLRTYGSLGHHTVDVADDPGWDPSAYMLQDSSGVTNPEEAFDPTQYMTATTPLILLLTNSWQPDIPIPDDIPPAVTSEATGGEFTNPTVIAHVTIRQPRFRYWIPGIPPLRLNQRDDDTPQAQSSPRAAAHATSRQASIRFGGNTYV